MFQRKTYKVNRGSIFEYRLKARFPSLLFLLCTYVLFLSLSMLKADSHQSMMITHWVFLPFIGLFIIVFTLWSFESEKTVIVLTEKSVERIVRDVTTTIISLNEVSEVKEIGRGFFIVKKGATVSSFYLSRSRFEEYSIPGVIYVPEMIENHYEIRRAVKVAMAKNIK